MTRRGALLFAAMSVIWGIPYLLIRVAVRSMDPSVLVFARTLIGAAVLLPFAISSGVLREAMRFWRWVALFGLVEMAVPWYLLSDAERRLPSALTGMFIAVVPTIGAVIARFGPAHERLDRVRLSGLAMGLVGVVLLLGVEFDARGVTVWALAEVMIVALCYATGPVIAARRLSKAPALGVNTLAVAGVALVYSVPGIVQLPRTMPPAAALWSVLCLAVVCTALAFVLFFALIREIGPSRSTVITYVNPVVALILGVLVLGEHLTIGMLVGFPLVLIGSVLATRKSAGRAPAAVPGPTSVSS